MRVIYESANKNLLPQIVDDGQGGVSIVTGTNALVENGFLGGTGAFAPPPPPPQGQQNQQNQSTQQQSSAATTAIPTRVQNLINRHNKTTDPRTQGAIRAEIGRILGGSIPPNVANQLR